MMKKFINRLFKKEEEPSGYNHKTVTEMAARSAVETRMRELELKHMAKQQYMLHGVTGSYGNTGTTGTAGITGTLSTSDWINSNAGITFTTTDMDSLYMSPTPEVNYASGILATVYKAFNQDYAYKDFSKVQGALSEILKSNDVKDMTLIHRISSITNQLYMIVSDPNYMKDERQGLLMTEDEDKEKFDKEQTTLNLVLNQNRYNNQSLYIFNASERAILMKPLEKAAKIVNYLVSGNKGDFEIGKELLRDL